MSERALASSQKLLIFRLPPRMRKLKMQCSHCATIHLREERQPEPTASRDDHCAAANSVAPRSTSWAASRSSSSIRCSPVTLHSTVAPKHSRVCSLTVDAFLIGHSGAKSNWKSTAHLRLGRFVFADVIVSDQGNATRA